MYRRIILKLSGETLAPETPPTDKGAVATFNAARVDRAADAIVRLSDMGVQVGVVMGRWQYLARALHRRDGSRARRSDGHAGDDHQRAGGAGRHPAHGPPRDGVHRSGNEPLRRALPRRPRHRPHGARRNRAARRRQRQSPSSPPTPPRRYGRRSCARTRSSRARPSPACTTPIRARTPTPSCCPT